DLVWRKRVLIRLVQTELGGGGAGEHALRDDRPPLAVVAVTGERVDRRLRHVLDDGEAPRHVAVEGTVADSHLALVPGRQDQPAELVREGHEEGPPDTSLDVLLRHVLLQPLEGSGQNPVEGSGRAGDREGEVLDPQVPRDPAGVRPGSRRGERRWHG